MLQIPRRPTGGFDKGSATTERRSVPAERVALTWQGTFLGIARLALLSSVFQASWYLGGTNIGAIYVSSILLSIATLAGLLALLSGWRFPKLLRFSWLPGTLLAGFVFLQCLPMPSRILNSLAPKIATVYREFGKEPAEQILTAGNLLRPGIIQTAFDPSLSLIKYDTERSLVTLLIALAILISSSFLFTTPSSRTFAVQAILTNATALAVWGIVQRAQGTTDLLPGVANPAPSIPFASFIYKNSAAAAIIPGIAAAMSLVYLERLTPNPVRNQDYATNRYYRHARQMLSTKALGYLAVGCMVASGVIASLSRGGWIASAIAVLIGLLVLRREWLHSRGFIALMGLLLLCIGITGRVASQVEKRMDLVTIEKLSDNERIEHWKLGWKTALQYLPLGSGYGTYGYATLIEQTQPTRVWFADAHNQYLEVFEELGLIGFTILVFSIVWTLKASWNLLNSNSPSESRSYGLFALVALTAAAIQSVGDFVMKLPPNLFQLSLIVGMLCAAVTSSKSIRSSISRWTNGSGNTSTSLPFALAICIGLIVLNSWTTWKASRELKSSHVLKETALATLEDGYDAAHVQRGIDALTKVIEDQPTRASLYRHRAMHYLAQYRHELIDAAIAENETLQWQQTRPEWLHAVLNSIPEPSRELTVQRMTVGDKLTLPLVNSLADMAQSIELNPLYSQVHATVLTLSPILHLAPSPWQHRFAALSFSDPEKLYLCGLCAFYQNDLEQAKNYWRLSLTSSPTYAQAICMTGLAKLSAVEIAFGVIPPERPELLINLVRVVLSPNFKTDESSLASSTKIATRIAENLLDNPDQFGDQSYAVAGAILGLTENHDRSADAWLKAIEKKPRDWKTRYQAAEALRLAGRWQEAIRHATLGASLSDDRIRFEQQIINIQQQIKTSK